MNKWLLTLRMNEPTVRCFSDEKRSETLNPVCVPALKHQIGSAKGQPNSLAH